MNENDTHIAHVHEAIIDAEQTMHDALTQSENMPLPMEVINEIHNKSDNDLKLTIGRKENDGAKARRRKRGEQQDDERRPARRTRNTMRWDERAHRNYTEDIYSDNMDIT